MQRRRQAAAAHGPRDEEPRQVTGDLFWGARGGGPRTPHWRHRRLLRSLWAGDMEPETARRRFLFQCDLGDPISSIHLGPAGSCMAGSVQGRVWLVGGSRSSSRGASWDGAAPPRAELLAGFSDEGVRGLFVDEDAVHATFAENCKVWTRSKPHIQQTGICFRSLDRKNTQSVKHVLQRGAWACVIFPLSTTLVNVARREHHHRPFKLFDYGSSADVAPCDFDGEQLVLINRTRSDLGPSFHLVHLERNEQKDLMDVPDAMYVSLVKLWGPDCIACVVGKTLQLYDHRKDELRFMLCGHAAEIIAVDARSEDCIATLSADAIVKLWCGRTGACLRTLHVPGANFFLAYPYCLCMQDQRVLVSSDEGVWLLELSPLSDTV
mmetsp:Transcript_81084/g.235199  ORF Transcript_81084/g.235199 Transcript_81084/m.235199 type:complete len:379 (-) Transcript_81084:224-1360(-)